jgi:hypothetical protein
MDDGKVKVGSTSWENVKSFLMGNLGADVYTHLYFEPHGQKVVDHAKPREAYFCPKCETVLIPGGPAPA